MKIGIFPLNDLWRAVFRIGILTFVIAAYSHRPVIAQTADQSPIRLKIVGGLGALNQYTRHEKPFWSEKIGALTKGRVTAEIQAFDQVGIRGQDILRLVQLGVVPFGTILLPLTSGSDPLLGAADLAGLNPDMHALRQVVESFRPILAKTLMRQYGIEMLGVYTYPAQTIFCNKRFSSLTDLKGIRIRTSSVTQSTFVKALGAEPVQLHFPGLRDVVKSGQVQCAVTGTMSGNTIGLHEVTTHISPIVLNWGLSVFGANSSVWDSLPDDVKSLLREEIQTLERKIWMESEEETRDGILCNTGSSSCKSGKKGKMVLVPPSSADLDLIKNILKEFVLPQWADQCGKECIAPWNESIGSKTGILIPN